MPVDEAKHVERGDHQKTDDPDSAHHQDRLNLGRREKGFTRHGRQHVEQLVRNPANAHMKDHEGENYHDSRLTLQHSDERAHEPPGFNVHHGDAFPRWRQHQSAVVLKT